MEASSSQTRRRLPNRTITSQRVDRNECALFVVSNIYPPGDKTAPADTSRETIHYMYELLVFEEVEFMALPPKEQTSEPVGCIRAEVTNVLEDAQFAFQGF